MNQGYGAPQAQGYGPPPQQQQQGGGPAYQIATVDAGCCSPVVDTNQVNGIINNMAAQGYRLVQIYMDVRNRCGPCLPTRAAVMIFRRADM
jgi:hypothetical protein